MIAVTHLSVTEIGVIITIVTTIFVVLLGALTKVGQIYVDRSVAVIDAKLSTICINVQETSVAVGRVHDLDVTLNNGIVKRVTRIEKQVDKLVDHQLKWDGGERRE